MTSTPEILLEEIEAKNRELIAKKTAPLLSFLKNKQRMREEKREERRWRKIEKGKEKRGGSGKRNENRKIQKDEPKIKLLKKPEKGDEKKIGEKRKAQEIGQRESE